MRSTYKDFFGQLRIIHYALMAGILLFAAVVYFVNIPTDNAGEGLYDIFRFLVPGMAAAAIIIGRFIGKTIFATAKEKEDMHDKLGIFRTGMIIRWALVEGVAMLSLVAFMLTSNLVMILVGLACVAYMFTLRPSPEAAGSALNLSESEYRGLF